MAVIDRADDGFNLSEEAMNTLTCVSSWLCNPSPLIHLLTRPSALSNGQAESLGTVDAISVQVDPLSLCSCS